MNKSILLSISATLLSPAFGATVIFQDNFEDETIGNAPSLGGGNVGSSYVAGLGTLSVQANPESAGNTSSQVLKGGDVADNASGYTGYFLGGSAYAINGMTVTFDFYSSSAGTNDNDSVRVALVGDTTNAGSSRDIFMRNDRDTLIKLDGNDQTEVNYGADVWQTFTAVFTTIDATNYSLAWTITNLETSASVSGSQNVVIGAGFTDTTKALGIYMEVFDSVDAVGYQGYIDNVTVTAVPEPSAAALALLGILGIVRRRR